MQTLANDTTPAASDQEAVQQLGTTGLVLLIHVQN